MIDESNEFVVSTQMLDGSATSVVCLCGSNNDPYAHIAEMPTCFSNVEEFDRWYNDVRPLIKKVCEPTTYNNHPVDGC